MADLNDDIARYLDGRMTPAEMNALERRALEDPFLADALAGGEMLSSDEFANDIVDLQQQLAQRVRTVAPAAIPTVGVSEQVPRGRQASLWSWPTRIAAGLLLVVSAGVVLYFISEKEKDAGNLAMKTETQPNASSAAASDSISGDVKFNAFAEEEAKQAEGDQEQAKQAATALQSSSDKSAAAPLSQPADPAGALKKPGSGNAHRDPASEDLAKTLSGRVGGVQVETNKSLSDEAPIESEIPTDAEGPPASRAEQRAAEQVARARSEAESKPALRADDARKDLRAQSDTSLNIAKNASPLSGYAYTDGVSQHKTTDLAQSEFEKGASKRKAAELNDAVAKTPFTGRVVDADGSPIPGVNVVVKGTNSGTVTDINGEYQLVDGDANPTLVYTFIGYTNVEQIADASKPATVTLSEDLAQLSEVVVVGYGAAKERTPEESTYELASPVGGKRAFKQYLENNMQYPPEAVLNNVEGRVTVTFEVESSGSLRDFKVIKGIGSGCDEEVIRLIKAGPKWTPTKKDEVAEKSLIKVRMRFQLPRKKKK